MCRTKNKLDIRVSSKNDSMYRVVFSIWPASKIVEKIVLDFQSREPLKGVKQLNNPKLAPC